MALRFPIPLCLFASIESSCLDLSEDNIGCFSAPYSGLIVPVALHFNETQVAMQHAVLLSRQMVLVVLMEVCPFPAIFQSLKSIS
jgi:hypothetical protein